MILLFQEEGKVHEVIECFLIRLKLDQNVNITLIAGCISDE